MPRWVAFAALTLIVLAVLLFSTRASARFLAELTAHPSDASDSSKGGGGGRPEDDEVPRYQVSKRELFANVALSHGLFAAVLLVGVVLAEIPVSSLGLEVGSLFERRSIALGIGIGLAIATANTIAGAIADALDLDSSGALRRLLTPESVRGWIALLFVVLPVVAGFEELLFRGILIGAFAVGFDLSPWLLAVVSSIAFAAGHGAQGRLGVVVTGALGFVLAAIFIWTDSLLVVVIAHYVVNAVEFVLVEGLEYEPLDRSITDRR